MRILVTLGCWVAVVLMLVGPAAAAESNSGAEYLGGTVKAIPANVIGNLDLTDPSDLVFRYGKSTYRLPFSDISGFQLTGPGAGTNGPRHHLGQVPLPGFSWVKNAWPGHERTLNLSYRTLGTVGVLSFKLIGKDFANADWVLKARTEPSEEEATNMNRAKLPEAWWGDRYWKTSHNSAHWGGPEPEAQSGTK